MLCFLENIWILYGNDVSKMTSKSSNILRAIFHHKAKLHQMQSFGRIDHCLSSTNNLEIPDFGGGRVVRWCWVNFQCRGVLLIWIIVEQGPIALAVGAGGGCLDIFFSRLSFLFSFSLSLGDGPI